MSIFTLFFSLIMSWWGQAILWVCLGLISIMSGSSVKSKQMCFSWKISCGCCCWLSLLMCVRVESTAFTFLLSSPCELPPLWHFPSFCNLEMNIYSRFRVKPFLNTMWAFRKSDLCARYGWDTDVPEPNMTAERPLSKTRFSTEWVTLLTSEHKQKPFCAWLLVDTVLYITHEFKASFADAG